MDPRRELMRGSAHVESVRIIRPHCFKRVVDVANRVQLGDILIDLVDCVRDLIEERLVVLSHRQAGAVDARVRNAVQAQQIIPQAVAWGRSSSCWAR